MATGTNSLLENALSKNPFLCISMIMRWAGSGVKMQKPSWPRASFQRCCRTSLMSAKRSDRSPALEVWKKEQAAYEYAFIRPEIGFIPEYVGMGFESPKELEHHEW